MITNQHTLDRDAVKQAAAMINTTAARSSPSSFATKISSSSQVRCKEEEFNVWHAAADNVVCNGANLAWGSHAKRAD